MAIEQRACPKCGGAGARVLYYDRLERWDYVCADKTDRVIRYVLSLECDHCGLSITGRDELVAHGLEPKHPSG